MTRTLSPVSAAAFAYLIFTFFAKKTVETWFAKRLKRFDYDLSSLFNRVTKIHEKEFEVLPEAWLKMQDALGRVSAFVSVMKYWPPLDKMKDRALEEFLATSRLLDHQKDELRESSQKLDYYQKTIFWHDLNDVTQAFSDFHNYIVRNKIFLSSDLQEQFSKVDDLIWASICEMEADQSSRSRDLSIKAYKKIRDDVNPIKDKIQALVQTRLHYHDVE